MEIILLEKILKLGEMGDVVKVRPGYARNFLFPQKKAVRVNAENQAYFEKHREALSAAAADRKAEAEKRLEALQSLEVITIEVNVDDNENLYGSIGPRDIARAIAEEGILLSKSEVLLGDVLRAAGEHEVRLRLHSEVTCTIKVALIPAQNNPKSS